MSKTFSLGKILGIQFKLHFSWFIIFFLVTGVLIYPNYARFSSWAIGIITSLLFFASVVVHELAHSLTAKANGIPVKSITLFIFGGVALMNREAPRPGAELKMALAGPVASLLLSGLFGLVWLWAREINAELSGVASWLTLMNLILATFNMIPGFPLDGGRIFRSLLWMATGNYMRSSKIATRTGQGFGYLLIAGGILTLIFQPGSFTWFDGIWISAVGWFLSSTALMAYNEINTLQASILPAIPDETIHGPDFISPGAIEKP